MDFVLKGAKGGASLITQYKASYSLVEPKVMIFGCSGNSAVGDAGVAGNLVAVMQCILHVIMGGLPWYA